MMNATIYSRHIAKKKRIGRCFLRECFMCLRITRKYDILPKPSLIFLLIAGLYISCKMRAPEEKVQKEDSTHAMASNEVDEDFERFISRFSSDSVFQISRIRFPLQGQELELGDPSRMVKRVVNKSEHHTLDFSPPAFKGNVDNYSLELKVKGDKATIEVRGVDNGIEIDYFFERKYGKWILITWTDRST